MRHFKALGLSAATGLATVLFCAPLASAAAPAYNHGPHGPEKVFELLTKETQSSFLHLESDGAPSQGDEFVFSEDVFRDGEKVGHSGGACTVTNVAGPGAGEQQCLVTLSLPEGQLTLQGLVTLTNGQPDEFDLAITGGTGKFRSASGFVHAALLSPTELRLTVHLNH